MLKTKSMLLAAAAFGLYGAAAVAETQTGTYGAETETEAQTQTGAQTGAHAGMDQPKHAQGKVKRASELMGKTVRDQQGEEIGQIEDFALDLQQGRLNYVVLDTGGFMEQRLVGISAEDLRTAPDDEEAFIAQVSQQEIEQAQALPDENWPSQPTVASGAQQGTDAEFAPFEGQGTEGTTDHGQTGGQGTTGGMTGTQEGAQTGAQTGAGVQTGMDRERGGQNLLGVQKASELMGKTVRDQQGEDIGQIEDFAVDLQQGQLNYVVINTGGFMAERLVGIAANDLRAAPDGDAFIANVTQQQIEAAQELPDQNWPAQPTLGTRAGGEFAPMEGQKQDQEWQQDQQ